MIDLHEPTVGQDPWSKEQGTSMTPKVHKDTGVNTDLNPRPQNYPQRGPTAPEKSPTGPVE